MQAFRGNIVARISISRSLSPSLSVSTCLRAFGERAFLRGFLESGVRLLECVFGIAGCLLWKCRKGFCCASQYAIVRACIFCEGRDLVLGGKREFRVMDITKRYARSRILEGWIGWSKWILAVFFRKRDNFRFQELRVIWNAECVFVRWYEFSNKKWCLLNNIVKVV